MTIFLSILVPIVGIAGVVLGVLLNEFMRRKNRKEVYAPTIFEKRLVAYEGLAEQIDEGSEIADEVINNSDLTAEERHDLISVPISTIAKYTDKYRLYIDPDLGVHCTALFMGVEDIQSVDGEERERLLKDFYHLLNEAHRMIEEDSGVAEINKLFREINRPKLGGPIIERIRELRQKRRKAD